MPNLGTTELIIILVIVLIIFGAGKLPRVSRDIGQGVRDFRHSIKLLQGKNENPSKNSPPG